MKEVRRRRILHKKYYKKTQKAISEDSLKENEYDLSFPGPPTKTNFRG